MKNYKFILTISSLLVLGMALATIYVDMPAPDKLVTKLLEVNDDAVQ
jgi:hypothetical protein